MIRETRRCPNGHTYFTIRPSNYKGAAEYPPKCPECRRA